ARRAARPTCGRDGRQIDAHRRHTAVRDDPAVAARDCGDARPRDVKDHARCQLVSAGDLYHGVLGHGLLGEALLKRRLIDVLDVAIHPVLVGAGRPFLREHQSLTLKLTATKAFSKIVTLTYEPQY